MFDNFCLQYLVESVNLQILGYSICSTRSTKNFEKIELSYSLLLQMLSFLLLNRPKNFGCFQMLLVDDVFLYAYAGINK